MIFYYIRHGDPIYNPDSLTELGKRQAEALAKRLALYGVDKIYSSTAVRAIQTAEPASYLMKKEIVQMDWCLERYAFQEMGIMQEGRRRWLFSVPEYRRLLASNEIAELGHRWHTHPAFAEQTVGEGYQRIQRETYKFLEKLGYRFDPQTGVYDVLRDNNERVALFAHQGFGMAFLSSLLNIPYPAFCTKFDMSHSGMTVIQFKNEGGICVPKVLTLGNDSHLYREGLPTKYQNELYF